MYCIIVHKHLESSLLCERPRTRRSWEIGSTNQKDHKKKMEKLGANRGCVKRCVCCYATNGLRSIWSIRRLSFLDSPHGIQGSGCYSHGVGPKHKAVFIISSLNSVVPAHRRVWVYMNEIEPMVIQLAI